MTFYTAIKRVHLKNVDLDSRSRSRSISRLTLEPKQVDLDLDLDLNCQISKTDTKEILQYMVTGSATFSYV